MKKAELDKLEFDEMDFNAIIDLFKLNYKHWQTITLCREISRNQNHNVTINEKINSFADKWVEPEHWAKLIPKFKKLFKDGHEIVLTTTQAQGDEGGPCYIAYLLKPGFKKQFYQGYDNIISQNPQTDPGLLYNMKYIITHPEQFTEIWAGPY